MTQDERLEMLRLNLQNPSKAYDPFLRNLLITAQSRIEDMGIQLADTVSDGMLCVDYAAYLFRLRASPDMEMPKSLVHDLHQKCFGSLRGDDDAP